MSRIRLAIIKATQSTREKTMLDKDEINQFVEQALQKGNWMLRRSDNGKSHNGFQWNKIGKWTEAPDWNLEAECGGGLHGNGVNTRNSYWGPGGDVDFCEINMDAGVVCIDGKYGLVKCRCARVLIRNELPASDLHA